MTDEIYVTDGLENAIDNLEKLDSFLEPPVNGSGWKWAIIAAHQALYCFLIAALQGTAPFLNVIEDDYRRNDGKKRKARIAYLCGETIHTIARSLGEKEDKVNDWLTNPKLISIGKALKRVKDKEHLHWSHSKPLETNEQEDAALSALIWEYRNNFEHFVPKTWVIYTAGFPDMFRHTMRVIQFIALESNTFFFYDENHKERANRTIDSINFKLQQYKGEDITE